MGLSFASMFIEQTVQCLAHLNSVLIMHDDDDNLEQNKMAVQNNQSMKSLSEE